MGKTKKSEAGFSAIEGILVLVIVVLLGVVGFMVYKNQNKSAADKTTTPASTSTQPTTAYFTVKEWGVRAPYTGQDTYTYALTDDDKIATVMSKQLAAKDSGCSTFGAGQIKRLSAHDDALAGGGGPTVEQYAKQNAGMYAYVGGYYYQFIHDQGQCGSVSVSDQNQANDAVKALVADFQVVPK